MNTIYDHLNNQVTVEVPIELLFTDLDVITTGKEEFINNLTPKWFHQHMQHCNISIQRLTPHINLFKFLMGYSNELPLEYISWYNNLYISRDLEPELPQEELLYKRYTEYRMMSSKFETDFGFFVTNASVVTYNNRGYFNINDGHHRTVFLFCKGIRKIPVKMSICDYNTWLNASAEQNLIKLFSDQNRDLIYTPILHPVFYGKDSERDTIYPTRMDIIMEYLGPRNLRNLKIIDIGCNIGYYSRQFTREGSIVTGIEPFTEHYEFLKILNRLEQVGFNLVTERFEECVLPKHDIGILLTVFYHSMNNEDIRIKFLNQLDRCISDLIFWESGDQIEEEKKLIIENTHFKSYEKLGITFGTGKIRELGVFKAQSPL